MRVESVIGGGRESARIGGAGALRGSVRFGPMVVLPLLPVFAACGSDDAPPTAGEPLPEGVDTAVRGMRTFVTRDGIRRAVVEADTAEWHEENQIHLRRMTLTFFDPNGLESTEVTAEFGIFHELTGDLEAERNVVVEDRRDDQRLETERLRYQNLDGRLYGDTAFHLLRGLEGLMLEGTGFESDPTLDSVLVWNQAGEMRPRVVYSGGASPSADSAAAAGDSTEVAAETTAEEPGPADAAAEPPGPADADAEPPGAEEAMPGDSMAAEVDPAVLPARDSAAPAPADSPAVDSLAGPSDSVPVLSDSVPVPPDSVSVPPDSVPVPPDTAPVLRDSVPVLADSVPVLSDSMPILPDSVPVLPDSIPILPDSVPVLPDTIPVPPDSVPAPPDTTSVPPDSVTVPPDTTAMERR